MYPQYMFKFGDKKMRFFFSERMSHLERCSSFILQGFFSVRLSGGVRQFVRHNLILIFENH